MCTLFNCQSCSRLGQTTCENTNALEHKTRFRCYTPIGKELLCENCNTIQGAINKLDNLVVRQPWLLTVGMAGAPTTEPWGDDENVLLADSSEKDADTCSVEIKAEKCHPMEANTEMDGETKQHDGPADLPVLPEENQALHDNPGNVYGDLNNKKDDAIPIIAKWKTTKTHTENVEIPVMGDGINHNDSPKGRKSTRKSKNKYKKQSQEVSSNC